MRLDLKQFGISVSIIKPGFIKTPLTDRNEFYMPFLISVEKAVQIITRIIEKKQAIASFPAPLAILARSLYFWPVWLYDWCFSGRRNRKKDPNLNV
jgi:short-subunit dehydrogenase